MAKDHWSSFYSISGRIAAEKRVNLKVTDELSNYGRYHDRRFQDLSLGGTRLVGGEFHDCQFKACSFIESVFHECRFVDCVFLECDLSLVQIPGSLFSVTRYVDSKVIGVDWTQADWSGISLGKAIAFERCAISHSTFIGLSLPGIHIKECIAADVDFREADLTKADFSGSDLADSLFLNTNLSKADLSTARNYHIAPEHNVLKGARFSLPEAMSLLLNMDIVLVEE